MWQHQSNSLSSSFSTSPSPVHIVGEKKQLIAFQPGLGRAPIHQAATQVVRAQRGLFKPAQTALLSAITTACTAVTRQKMKIKDLTGAGRGHPVLCSASLQPMDAIPSDASDELLCSPYAWMRWFKILRATRWPTAFAEFSVHFRKTSTASLSSKGQNLDWPWPSHPTSSSESPEVLVFIRELGGAIK